MGARPGTSAQKAQCAGERQISQGLSTMSLTSTEQFSCRQGRVDHAVTCISAPPGPSQRTDCSQGHQGCPCSHPGLAHATEEMLKPLTAPSAWLWCIAVPRGHIFSCAAWLWGWTKGHLHFTRISFDKMFLPRDSQYAGALAAPRGLASPSRPCAQAAWLLQSRCQDACSPTDSWAWRLKKPAHTLAAMSPAAYCQLLLWERLHLRDWQSSPEHAPVTRRRDLDYNSPAACAAQAFWPCANAVHFAYWSIFSSPRGLSYEIVVQKLICAALVTVLLLLPCGYGYRWYFAGNHEEKTIALSKAVI